MVLHLIPADFEIAHFTNKFYGIIKLATLLTLKVHKIRSTVMLSSLGKISNYSHMNWSLNLLLVDFVKLVVVYFDGLYVLAGK